MSASKERLYFLLQVAAHQLRKGADAALLEKADLSTAQVAVLNLIAVDKPVNQRDLAKQLKQNESAITAMVQRLIKAGYITRHRHPKDARNWVLEITQEGAATLEKGSSAFAAINARLDKTLGIRETKKFAEQLNKLVNAFSREK